MNKSEFTAYLITFVLAGCLSIWILQRFTSDDQPTSYSQNCWQVGDTLFVLHDGDTVRLDIKRLEGE